MQLVGVTGLLKSVGTQFYKKLLSDEAKMMFCRSIIDHPPPPPPPVALQNTEVKCFAIFQSLLRVWFKVQRQSTENLPIVNLILSFYLFVVRCRKKTVPSRVTQEIFNYLTR